MRKRLIRLGVLFLVIVFGLAFFNAIFGGDNNESSTDPQTSVTVTEPPSSTESESTTTSTTEPQESTTTSSTTTSTTEAPTPSPTTSTLPTEIEDAPELNLRYPNRVDSAQNPPPIIVQDDQVHLLVPDDGGETIGQLAEFLILECEEAGFPNCTEELAIPLETELNAINGDEEAAIHPAARYCNVHGYCYDAYDIWGRPLEQCNIWADCVGGRDIWGRADGQCDIWGRCHEE